MKLSKVELDNLKELYKSLQSNVGDISRQLTEQVALTKKAKEEYELILIKIIEVDKNLQIRLSKLEDVNKTIARSEASIKQREEEAESRLTELFVKIEEAEKEIIQNNQRVAESIRRTRESSEAHTEITGQMQQKRDEIVSHNDTISSLIGRINDLRREYDSTKTDFEIIIKDMKKEIDSLLSERGSIIQDIASQKEERDSFYIIKNRTEESFRVRQHDLDILQARIVEVLRELKIPFKL